MKKSLMLALLCSLLPEVSMARSTVLQIPLAEVLAMPEAQGKLDGSVRFFLAGQNTPAVQKSLGEGVSNQKTNGVGKSDEFGCKWAALSALLKFQQSAKQRGANAVVDLVSYYKKNTSANAVTFECYAGNIMIGVTLKGTYATVAD